MQVIETSEQFVSFQRSYANENRCIVIPILSDSNKHPLKNSLSLLYVRFMSGDSYMLVFDHSEGSSLDIKLLEFFRKSDVSILTPDKKYLSHILGFYGNIYDMDIVPYLAGKSLVERNCATNTHRHFYNNFPSRSNLNRVIPIVKHIDMCDQLADTIMKEFVLIDKDVYSFYNNVVIPAFGKIEQVGLNTHSKMLYSEYNLYTATGRPSNRYGGTNFAALNKSDGTRKQFISRYENGGLLQYDYNAYHIHLIANHIGYDMPADAHTHLGQQYFEADELTEDMYESSKEITFQYLYGRIPTDLAREIPFFARVKEFISSLWNEMQTQGYVKSPVSGRKIYRDKIDPINPEKVFNYFIQLLETETNCLVLDKLHKYLEARQTKLILYTYDSYLFDTILSDGKEFFQELKDIIEQNGLYKTKCYIGVNYHDLKEL